MSGMPAPEDIGVKVMLWFGAPAVVVAIFTSVLDRGPDSDLRHARNLPAIGF